MENTAPEPGEDEDFAQALADLKSTYKVTDSAIAQRIGVSVSAVNTWVHRKRAPRSDAIRALAREFPKFTESRLFAAAGRAAPGPLNPDREQRLLEYYRQLTEEQQVLTEIQMKAWAERNGT